MLAIRLGPAEVRCTGRAQGDFSVRAGAARDARQRDVVDRPWKTAKQVHGSRVVVVDAGINIVGEADALVTTDRTIAVAVRTADCAPVALAGDGVAAVVHAGWRGLAAGIVGEAVATMRALGARDIEAVLGPCVHPECYEFGARDLERMVELFGRRVIGVTSKGAPALDVPAAVAAALTRADVPLAVDVARCTSCEAEQWWSHRARGEDERQATVVWLR